MTIGTVVFVAISARIAGVLWVTIISGSRAASSVASFPMSPSRPPAEIQSNTKFCPCIHPRSARTLVRVSRSPKMLLGGQGSITRSLPTRRGCWAMTCVTDMKPKTRLATARTHAPMRRPELSKHVTASSAKFGSLDHLVGAGEERGRDREAEGVRRLHVNIQLELVRLLNGQHGRFSALDNLIHVHCGATQHLHVAWCIGHERAGNSGFAGMHHRRQTPFERRLNDMIS